MGVLVIVLSLSLRSSTAMATRGSDESQDFSVMLESVAIIVVLAVLRVVHPWQVDETAMAAILKSSARNHDNAPGDTSRRTALLLEVGSSTYIRACIRNGIVFG